MLGCKGLYMFKHENVSPDTKNHSQGKGGKA